MHRSKHTHMHICTRVYILLQPPLLFLIGLLHLATMKIGIDLAVHENTTLFSSSGDPELLGPGIGMCDFWWTPWHLSLFATLLLRLHMIKRVGSDSWASFCLTYSLTKFWPSSILRARMSTSEFWETWSPVTHLMWGFYIYLSEILPGLSIWILCLSWWHFLDYLFTKKQTCQWTKNSITIN